MTELKPAAGYIRIPPGQQAHAAVSMEQQRHAIERDAARCGYVVIEWYLDSGPDGRLNFQPDLRCLMSDSCSPQHPFHAVYVACPSRISRDASVNEDYRRVLRKHGIRLLSAQKPQGIRIA